MHRLIHPGDRQALPMRMLFHPLGEGVYLKACKADSLRGLAGMRSVPLWHGPLFLRLL